ncbi:hypothetical protein QFZ99_005311 [Paraburkholderia atlantica]
MAAIMTTLGVAKHARALCHKYQAIGVHMSDDLLLASPSRRRFVGVSAAALAAAPLSRLAFAQTSQAITDIKQAPNGDKTAIRPLRVHVPEAQLVDLRRRIKATRWPDKETVNDESQGVPLAMMQELARHWSTDYDWRRCETRLNALPNFVTEIDGLDIHFIHVRSKYQDAMPLIVTHGWPGSVIEQFKIIDPLTNGWPGSVIEQFKIIDPLSLWCKRFGRLSSRHSVATRLRLLGQACGGRLGP